MKKSVSGCRTFEHTADIGIEAWGGTAAELFEEAASGLFSLMADLNQVRDEETVTLQVEAENTEELFLAWLKELLYLFDTRKILLSNFKILKLSAQHLSAKVSGEKLDPAKHKLGREVKAVTRHLFEFQKTETNFRARFILDI